MRVGPSCCGVVTVVGIGPSGMGYIVGCGGDCCGVEGGDVVCSRRDGGVSIRRRNGGEPYWCRVGGESIRRRLDCAGELIGRWLECVVGVDDRYGGCEFDRTSTKGVDCEDSPTSEGGVCTRDVCGSLSSCSLTTSDSW